MSDENFKSSDYYELCLQRLEVIKLIPDVKPRLALQVFNDLFSWHFGYLKYVDGKAPITTTDEDWAGAFDDGGVFGRYVITPHGAKILKRLFEAGAIPQKRKSASGDLSALQAYIDSEPDLKARAAQNRRDMDAAQAARDAKWREIDDRAAYLANHPEDASPDEITAQLIDRFFIHKSGYGAGGSATLGGCEVHKTIDYYESNSGKTSRSDPRVWWTDQEGYVHGDPEAPRPNRRSDPERNWGLGRE